MLSGSPAKGREAGLHRLLAVDEHVGRHVGDRDVVAQAGIERGAGHLAILGGVATLTQRTPGEETPPDFRHSPKSGARPATPLP
jgi:hypothetical protein